MAEKTREQAWEEVKARRTANFGRQVNNASLYAGSPMYFYCNWCSALSDTLPENYVCTPKRVCTECQKLLDAGLLP